MGDKKLHGEHGEHEEHQVRRGIAQKTPLEHGMLGFGKGWERRVSAESTEITEFQSGDTCSVDCAFCAHFVFSSEPSSVAQHWYSCSDLVISVPSVEILICLVRPFAR